MSSRWRGAVIIRPEGEAVGGEPGRDRDRREVRDVGEHRQQRRGAGVALLAADLGRHRAFGGERRARIGRREQHVDVVEQLGDLELEHLALRPRPRPNFGSVISLLGASPATTSGSSSSRRSSQSGGTFDELVGRLHERVDADEVVDLHVDATVDELGGVDQRVARRGGGDRLDLGVHRDEAEVGRPRRPQSRSRRAARWRRGS